MNTTPRRRTALAAVAVLSLVAAACGSDSDDAVSTAPSTDAAATTAADDPVETTGSVAVGRQFGPACSAVPADGAGSFAGMAQDPAATAASNNPILSTLVAAVQQAGLVDTLNGDGPFTIFAPTDDAFAAIPADQLEAALADQDLLTSILTYHVVAGRSLTAAELGGAGELETVNGASIELGPDGTTVNGAEVVCSDVATANATVHIIDQVLLPPSDPTDDMTGGEIDDAMSEPMSEAMPEPSGPACSAVPADGAGSFAGMAQDPAATAASNNPILSTLVAAVQQAGLVDTLNGDGPFTIFAPTDDAFAAIPADQLEAVLADQDLLTSILTHHVVAGERLSSRELIERGSVETVGGGTLTFTDDAGLTVDGATAACMDVPTANATVHIITGVLLPQS